MKERQDRRITTRYSLAQQTNTTQGDDTQVWDDTALLHTARAEAAAAWHGPQRGPPAVRFDRYGVRPSVVATTSTPTSRE